MHAGIDEAGRGAWAGPVVAAAVALDYGNVPQGIMDSKQLIPRKRDMLYEKIFSCAAVGVGIADVAEIARLNILRATLLAMERAYKDLGGGMNAVLVDGTSPPRLPCAVKTVIKGDNTCLSIAAASIVAKVTRDRIMASLHKQYPQYDWNKNMGYGTAAHHRALKTLGPTLHHREGYAPIRALLQERLYV